jgi:hypothetical protein
MAADDELLLGPGAGLGDEQTRMNQSTRGQWDWYAAHRRAIERLIVPEGRGGRLCVLGAGNCNDLDLKWLTAAYAEVHLVDIDRGALERAVARQGVKDAGAIRLHAPVDLTGIAGLTAAWRGRAVSGAEVAEAVRSAREDGSSLGGGEFDVVLSPCVLSQLLMGVRELLGKDHPGWPGLKAAIIGRHLSTVSRSTRPGGRGVMVVDLASSRVVPGLGRAGEAEVPDVMRMCVRDRRCFHGLEPAELGRVFRQVGVTEAAVSPPWVWHLGFGKAFLCYGMTVRQGGAATPAAGRRG